MNDGATFLTIGLVVITIYTAACLFYVYRFRGNIRFENFSEYLRKGWPIFTPLNCLLYLLSQRRACFALPELKNFPELEPIRKNWPVIREEAVNLYQHRYFESTSKPGSKASFDIGFRTFFKYGWSKFYVNWYGYTHQSAKDLCPRTVEILRQVPSINGAMFSLLPAGGQLTRHLDPVASSLRYHLGLMTPSSDRCFLNVDGHTYAWSDGGDLLFDETYLHFAKNQTEKDRIILMCDVDRPMNLAGRLINFFYKRLMRLTLVPNLNGDKRGLVNVIFSGLSPVLQRTKALKDSNKSLYLVIKYSVNLTLLAVAIIIAAGVFWLIGVIVGSLDRLL